MRQKQGEFPLTSCDHNPENCQEAQAVMPKAKREKNNLSLGDSLKSDQRKAFYEGHKNIALIMIIVVFLFPLFGVYSKGLLGAVFGMIISIGAYFLTPYVTRKIGE